MTAQLFLAANLVPDTLVFGHLQIVYEDVAGNLLENETTSPGFPFFFGDWAFPEFGRPHDDTSNTPGYGDAQDYAIVSVDLRPQQAATYVWELLGQVHASLSGGGHGLNYDFKQNSNSYVASALSVVGIDIGDYLADVQPDSVTGFPGVDTDIFQGARTGGLFSRYDTPLALTLAGTSGDDYFITGIGNDSLGGAAGNDEIHAGNGADTVSGGSGNDTIFGGGASDLLDGGAHNDYLRGDDGKDTLFGQRGNDTLLGGQKDDLIYGGSHYDDIHGQHGNDTIYGGNGRDTVYGGNGNDVLHDNGQSGVYGGDHLVGGNGNDTIRIGGGNDTATGGAAADAFVFFGGSIGADVVTDYQTGTDALTLDDALWDGGLSAAQVVSQYASVVDGYVVFDFGGGNTVTLQGIGSTAGLAADMDFI